MAEAPSRNSISILPNFTWLNPQCRISPEGETVFTSSWVSTDSEKLRCALGDHFYMHVWTNYLDSGSAMHKYICRRCNDSYTEEIV